MVTSEAPEHMIEQAFDLAGDVAGAVAVIKAEGVSERPHRKPPWCKRCSRRHPKGKTCDLYLDLATSRWHHR